MTLDLDRLEALAQKALDRPLNDNRWGLGDKLPTPRETLALVAVAKAAQEWRDVRPGPFTRCAVHECGLAVCRHQEQDAALASAVDALKEGNRG